MAIYTTLKKQSVVPDSELGRGGEGIIYSFRNNVNFVAKVYHSHHRTVEKERKLLAMISNPPSDNTLQLSPPHISVAWPVDLLYENGRFAGYVMPKIFTSPEIFEVFNPITRKQKYPNFDWRYAHRTAQNLAIALNSLHARDYVMGDVNQKNVLVTSNAMITLVDTDSFQVSDTNGRVYRCPVGVPEYTPPELQGISLNTVDRFAYHDNFGLAVLIFQLLMDGNHPFMGVPRDLRLSVGKVDEYCIRRGIFPYSSNGNFLPPPHAPRIDSLHPKLQKLFTKTFIDGYRDPRSRAGPIEWASALQFVEGDLKQCGKNSKHWYSIHAKNCHWCEREKQKSAPIQTPLPTPVNIHPRGNYASSSNYAPPAPRLWQQFSASVKQRLSRIAKRFLWLISYPIILIVIFSLAINDYISLWWWVVGLFIGFPIWVWADPG